MAEGTGGGGRRRARGPVVEGEFAQGTEVGTALIMGETLGIRSVRYAIVEDRCIFEGDIDLGSVEEVAARNQELTAVMSGATAAGVAISGAQFRWPDCRVPFDVDPNLPDQGRVTQAIAHWEANTVYRFVPRTGDHDDWVTFRPGSGCSAAVGRRGGQQFVNLSPNCPLGSVIHEIGHVVGLWHEQSREDRDMFVTVHLENVQAGMEHNFDQHITDGDDIGPYDYGSIMHYPRTAFSKNGQDTIVPTDPNAQIGQRTGLSAGDIAAANSLCPRLVPKGFREPPTIKEFREPPTIKEFREPPTGKEFREPPTIKEFREPPTIKEFREPPVTGKEFVEPPVTGKEFREPPVLPGLGGLPFAMAAPHQAGDPGGGLAAQADELGARLDAIEAALTQADADAQALRAQQAEAYAALAEVLRALGYL